MLRSVFCLVLISVGGFGYGQQHSIGFGVHSGFTIPVTLDLGMDRDPRYNPRYSLKAAPIGVTIMKDWEGFGFVLSPGLVTIGQDYDIVNTEGGHFGRRNINMKYFTLPAAFKLHLIDLDFFRVSALASVSGAYLFDADDRISHDATKLTFPEQTFPSLPDGYQIEYDGVLVPVIRDQINARKENFNSVQVFAGLGLRSDWDVTNHWRVSFDVRVHYGFLDSRNNAYLQEIENFEHIYDQSGNRNEMFAHVSFGIVRYIDFDKSDRDREKKLKGSKKRYSPQAPSRRRAKPRG
jgi:hypothetical protein